MKAVIISGAVILAVFIAILIMIPKGIEPLTEVYFENHTSLPKYLFLNQTYNYSFTVRNLEYTPMQYEYIINVYDKNDSLMYELDRERFNLSDNESITFNEEFNFSYHFENAKVSVLLNKLTSGNEINAQRRFWWKDENYPNNISIHFLVEEITGPKIIITED